MSTIKLESKISSGKGFSINRESYRADLKAAATKSEQIYQGTHGLRWNYAQDRFKELQEKGAMTRDEALQQVSWEMKHERADITEHYLR